MIASDIVLVAMRVRKVNRIKPMAGPSFAITLGHKQPINKFLVGICIGIGNKRLHFLRSRGQAGQIVTDTADQCASISGR